MSDLLNSASLVLIPSGYKEDVVYSEIPTDGSGDLTFTRASDGTRINSAGLVENCPWNIAQQSNTFGTSPWSNTLDTGATLTYTANYGTAPDGTMTAGRLQMALNGSNYAQKNQIISVVTGQQYTYSVWIKSASGTKTVIFCYDNTNNITATVTEEWQRFTHTFTGNSQVYARFVLEAGTSTSVDLLIYGAQLNIGSTAKPYFPTTNRQDVPRLTYQNGGGGCPSLLLEKQSTNLALYSEQFENWNQQNLTVTANSTISPDGTQNADLLTLNTLNGEHNVYTGAFTITANAPFTFSCYVKKGTGRYIAAATYFAGVGFGPYATFDLNTATLVSSGAPFGTYVNSKIESTGNDWYRISVTGYGNYTSLIVAPDVRSASYLVPGFTFTGAGETLYLWGAQAEASSYPTSYIPTQGSSVTRLADACYKTGISSLIGQSEGTLFFSTQFAQHSGTGNDVWYTECVNDDTSNGILIYSSNNTLVDVYINNSGTNITMNGSVDITQPMRVALAYKSGDFALYINGVLKDSKTTSFTFPSNINQFALAKWVGLPTEQKMSVNQAVLFPTRLTNAQLASLTTL